MPALVTGPSAPCVRPDSAQLVAHSHTCSAQSHHTHNQG